MYPSKFLIFVVSELLGAKIKESKSNQILYIYIERERERPLHILEIYGL